MLLVVLGLSGLSGCVVQGSPVPGPTVTVTVTLPPETPSMPEATDPGEPSASYAKASTCALGESGIALLSAGGKAAQAFAALIAEHVDDQDIKHLAERVRDATDTDETRKELAAKLDVYCATP